MVVKCKHLPSDTRPRIKKLLLSRGTVYFEVPKIGLGVVAPSDCRRVPVKHQTQRGGNISLANGPFNIRLSHGNKMLARHSHSWATGVALMLIASTAGCARDQLRQALGTESS